MSYILIFFVEDEDLSQDEDELIGKSTILLNFHIIILGLKRDIFTLASAQPLLFYLISSPL